MKEIPGFSRYFATEDGSLYSKDYKRTGLTKVIKPAKEHGRYYGRNELAKKYGVTESHIKDIVNDQTLWKSA